MSFPKFTYSHLAFPELSLSRTDLNELSVSGKAIVPALRTRMECRTYDSNDIRFNYTYTNWTLYYSVSRTPRSEDMDTLQVSIKEEECISNPSHMNTGHLASPYNIETPRGPISPGYLGIASIGRQNSSGCSDLLYFWGYTDPNRTLSTPIMHIAAMGCNVSYEAVDVDTTFIGPDLRIDPAHPPKPDNHTARPVPLASSPFRSGIYAGLEPFYGRAEGDLRDNLFSILSSSPWGIPYSYLNDSSADLAVAEAIKFQHGIIEAQILSMSKIPASKHNTSNAVYLGLEPDNMQQQNT